MAIEHDVAIAAAEAKKLIADAPSEIKSLDVFTAANTHLQELLRVRKNIDKARAAVNREHQLAIQESNRLFGKPIEELKSKIVSLSVIIKEFK